MALMGCVIDEKSAIGVARSQRMTPYFGEVSADGARHSSGAIFVGHTEDARLESRAPSHKS